MDIEQRAMELIQRNFHASANPDDLCADIAALIREAVAEVTPSRGADYKAEAMAWREAFDCDTLELRRDCNYGYSTSSMVHAEFDSTVGKIRAANEAAEAAGRGEA